MFWSLWLEFCFERMLRKSKAQRTCAASYNVRLFVLAEAAKRFEEKVVHKAIILQREFLLPSVVQCTTYIVPIKARKWETLYHPPEASCVPLVREFFANSPDRINSKIYVRGTWVTFTKQIINEYYRLPTLGDDEDYLRVLSEIDMTMVYSFVCKSRMVWKMSGGRL